MVKIKNILGMINTIAPFDLAEDWDNSGLQVGNENWKVTKVMIALDVSMSVMDAAKKAGCNLVLTHHPLLFRPEKSIDFAKMPGKAIEIAARHKISIIAAHTNLDKACDGLNDYFAAKIGLQKTKVFCLDSPLSIPIDKGVGMGRIGDFESPIPLKQLVLQIKETLNMSHLRVTGDMDLPVTCAAICTGSGGSLVNEFLRSRADVYITGDIKYHEARQIEEHSKGLIDVGHFGSEHMAIDLLFEKLGQAIQIAGLKIQIEKFKKEKDPFTIL